MFAQLGSLIFEPLSGFDSYSDSEEQVIAQYKTIAGKPWVHGMAPDLREINIVLRWHQRFISVKEARAQLRAYLEQGSTVALSWGTGEIEGRWLVKSLNTVLEEMDNHGNVYCCNVSVTLLEVAGDGDSLLQVKQVDAKKGVFGITTFSSTVVIPPKLAPTQWQIFKERLKLAMRYAALIDALAYGGKFPVYLGSSMGQIIGNARANLVLMGADFDSYGGDWDVPDVSAPIGDVIDSLDALAILDPVTDVVAFVAENKVMQGLTRVLCF